ncbi:protogenin B-like isoform X2 [Artemia franciscana]|uniref:protogenin B-like isoform X2 n=1 Tax=Artemia franciscana TaxID=6661 RepID=UPI0032DB6119
MAFSRGLVYFLIVLAFWNVQANFVFDPQVSVKVPVKFEKEPRDVIIQRGGSTALDCVAESEIQANVSWRHGSLVIVPDPRRHVLANGSLMFEKVLYKRSGRPSSGPGPGGGRSGNVGSDEGEYACLLTTEVGTIVSRTAHLRIAFLAREFLESPNDHSANLGDNVRFQCAIESWPPANLTWEKDGKPLDLVNSRFISLNPGVIFLRGVQLEDSGNYRCVAKNPISGRVRKSRPGQLSVDPVPSQGLRFVSPPQSGKVFVHLGGQTFFECAVNGAENIQVSWTLNGQPFLTDRNSTVRPFLGKADEDILILANVSINNTGEYACNATDGQNFLTKVWRVVVMEPPRLVQMPRSSVYPTAKTARLECEVRGIPKPDIRWLKDGNPVNIGGRIKQRTKNEGATSELVLSNSITADSGLYQCVAESRAGYTSASARILVNASQGRPDPPFNLKATAISSTQVLLSWQRPKNIPADEIKAFTVHYMPTDGGDELQDLSANVTCKIEKLRPYTNYTFYVRAYSRKSASDQSDRVTVTTGEDVPVVAPEVTLVPLNPTTLFVTWQKLPEHLIRGSATHNRIECRRHKQQKSDMYVVKPEVQEYIIRDLHPGKKYDVRVLPGNKKSFQQDRLRDYKWYTTEMPRIGGEAGHIAPDLYLICTSHSAIQVGWTVSTASVPGFEIPRRFLLSYQQVTFGQHYVDIKVPVNTTSIVIDNLVSDSIYEVKLTSYTEDPSSGLQVSKFIRTLSPDLLANEEVSDSSVVPPSDLEVKMVKSQSMKISWTSPDLNVTYFTVKWQNLELSSDFGFLRSTSENVNVTSLKPYVKYMITVQVSVAEGKSSPWSDVLEVRTKADVPSEPKNLSWITLDKQVQILWSPPDKVNGILLGYTLFFTVDPSLPVTEWEKEDILPLKIKAKVSGLQPGSIYTARMAARTSAGNGPLSSPITIDYSLAMSDSNISPNGTFVTSSSAITEQQIGIILGLSVALLLILLTMLIALWRFRCTKQSRLDGSASTNYQGNANVAARAARNSHVFLTSTLNGSLMTKIHAAERSHESASQDGGNSMDMEVFTPMLATLPPDASVHIDTKGGYPSLQRSSKSNSLQRTPSSRATDNDEGISVLAEVSDCAWAQKSQEDSKENQYLPNRLEEWADVTAITSLDLSTMVEEPCPACGDKVSSSVSSFVSPTRSTYSSTLGATSPLLSSVNTPCTPTGEVWSARIIATPVKVVQEDLPMVCIGEVSSHYVD